MIAVAARQQEKCWCAEWVNGMFAGLLWAVAVNGARVDEVHEKTYLAQKIHGIFDGECNPVPTTCWMFGVNKREFYKNSSSPTVRSKT